MWWRALGVAPTDNKETVKKAYAALIKTVDQDKDIEAFTNIHSAYRMAMKSFKKTEADGPSGLIDYEGQAHWYLLELAKIYNNPKRRLKTEAWKDIFACMSFIEEKHFLSQYVSFFNEHYALTEDIWTLIEKYYPLSNRSDFRWSELVKGYMKVTADEIKDLSFEEASSYVTYKILSYYAILDGDYLRSLDFLKMLSVYPDHKDISRWYLLCVTELNLKEAVEEAYFRLRQIDRSTYMADYLYSGYLMKGEDYTRAQELLAAIDEDNQDSRIRSLIDECEGHMSHQHQGSHINKPWLELDGQSPKVQKILEKGDYIKGLQKDQGNKFKLWGRR